MFYIEKGELSQLTKAIYDVLENIARVIYINDLQWKIKDNFIRYINH